MRLIRAFAAVALAVALERVVAASPASDSLRARAFEAAYNLDYDEATSLFRQAITADPRDPAAYRGLAAATWLHLVFRRGAVTVDHYLGGVTKQKVDLKRPPAELAAAFHENIDRAIALAEQQSRANPRDVAARYDLGSALGLLASYNATIDGQVMGAFKAARRAYDEHEDVLRIDPQRKSAALIVGTYRYLVSNLSMPTRWMAYLAGFGGGKELGLRMIEEAAAAPGDAQSDARFALIILYNREGRHADALRVLQQLQRQHTRNRLLWLEAGATALRARRWAEAERSLNDGIERLQGDRRPRMFGEESLWFYKRGAARVGLKQTEAARSDLDHALQGDVQTWVRGRVHIEFGKLADLAGDRSRARTEYARAIEMCRMGNDPAGELEARTLRDAAYRGTT